MSMQDKVSEFVPREAIDDDLAVVDFVADRLEPDAKAAFLERLRDDAELQSHVDEERQLHDLLVNGENRDMPGPEAFEGLRQEVESASAEPSLADTSTASSWRRAAAAAVLVAAAGAALISYLPDVPVDGEFGTLSSDEVVPLAESRQARIVFTADTDESGREAAAASFGFRIIAASGPANTYVVESPQVITRDELALWRADPRIDLAEPIRYGNDP